MLDPQASQASRSQASTCAPALSEDAGDPELAALAANGDDRAFERIMRRHNRLLFRTARSILKSDAETEDALQEAYPVSYTHLTLPTKRIV